MMVHLCGIASTKMWWKIRLKVNAMNFICWNTGLLTRPWWSKYMVCVFTVKHSFHTCIFQPCHVTELIVKVWLKTSLKYLWHKYVCSLKSSCYPSEIFCVDFVQFNLLCHIVRQQFCNTRSWWQTCMLICI